MELEWDETKRQKVLEERGIDLLYAACIFEGPVVTRADLRSDYGEERMVSLGMVEGECYLVVHTQRGPKTRLITASKGGRNEQKFYEASHPRRNHEDAEGRGTPS